MRAVTNLEADVGDDLFADVVVETLGELLAAHGEVGTQGGIGEADVEGLVVDVGVEGVAGDDGTSDHGPRLDETLLLEGHLETLLAQVAQDEVLDGLYVALEHRKNIRSFFR